MASDKGKGLASTSQDYRIGADSVRPIQEEWERTFDRLKYAVPKGPRGKFKKTDAVNVIFLHFCRDLTEAQRVDLIRRGLPVYEAVLAAEYERKKGDGGGSPPPEVIPLDPKSPRPRKPKERG